MGIDTSSFQSQTLCKRTRVKTSVKKDSRNQVKMGSRLIGWSVSRLNESFDRLAVPGSVLILSRCRHVDPHSHEHARTHVRPPGRQINSIELKLQARPSSTSSTPPEFLCHLTTRIRGAKQECHGSFATVRTPTGTTSRIKIETIASRHDHFGNYCTLLYLQVYRTRNIQERGEDAETTSTPVHCLPRCLSSENKGASLKKFVSSYRGR